MIRFANVCKSYGSIRALSDLSLEIHEGEIFGLLGPNGAGKSTAVHLAVGLLTPDAGTVELVGIGSPSVPATRAKIGVAPQALALYDELTAAENLRFFAEMQRLRGDHLRNRVTWALQFAGLTDRRNDRVKTYSGGMKRRLNMAIAIVHEPMVILFDEPTVGVDPQSRNAIFESILQLKQQGRTIVYTTHYMEEAQRLCDRVGIIDHGKLLAIDTVDSLIATHGGTSRITVDRGQGDEHIDTPDPMTELAKLSQDSRVRRFTVDRPNLESVFLKLTGRHLRD